MEKGKGEAKERFEVVNEFEEEMWQKIFISGLLWPGIPPGWPSSNPSPANPIKRMSSWEFCPVPIVSFLYDFVFVCCSHRRCSFHNTEGSNLIWWGRLWLITMDKQWWVVDISPLWLKAMLDDSLWPVKSVFSTTCIILTWFSDFILLSHGAQWELNQDWHGH